MRVNEHIRFEPDEPSPPFVTLGVAAQGAVIALSNVITLATIFAVAADGSPSYLSWAVFASLVVGGAVTALHAARFGRFGSGYILLAGPGSPFLAVCVLAAAEGGLPVMSSLIVAASVVQFAVALWLAQLRRIITPVVSGVTFMVVAVSAMPIAAARLDDVPPGAPSAAGPAIGAVVLAVMALLMLRGSGSLRLLAIPLTIVLSCGAAVLLRAYDFQPAADAPWFGLPEFSAWPGLGPVLDTDFWALLAVFLIVSVVVAIQASNQGSAIQPASRRRPRAVDFRSVQGTMNAGGIGILLSGIAGTLPTIFYLSLTTSLIGFTGVAARRVGLAVGAMLIALPMLPKVVALLLTIPRPVTGAILLVIMGMLFIEGIRTAMQDGFTPRKAFIIGLSLSIGVGLQGHNVLADVLGSPWGVAFGNSVVVGVAAAVLMSAVLETAGLRRRRLETQLDMAALPGIQEFLRGLASRMGWDPAATERLCSAGEETLSSMLQLRDDYEGTGGRASSSSRAPRRERWRWSFWRCLRRRTSKTASPT